MFGYIRPLKSELKVREFEEFNSVYCGLCHTLGKRYGVVSRFLINYDFTFLTLILTSLENQCEYRRCRCIASPFRKKRVCCSGVDFELATDQCVILTNWKIRDGIKDGRFTGRLLSRLALLFVRAPYKRAALRMPQFDVLVSEKLKCLDELEREKSPSLDMAADTFASILASTVRHIEDASVRRPLEQMLYHIGRWIYIVDAYDDLKDDFHSGAYNPLIYRFDLKSPELSQADKECLELTAFHSVGLAAKACELVPFKRNGELIMNVILMGMPFVWRQVSTGVWNTKSRGKI